MVLSVSELNEYIRRTLAIDSFVQNIALKGEISNFKAYASGHWYFTLKDSESSISCVMFAQHNFNLTIPEDGMAVELVGGANIYTKTGQLQFYATSLKAGGKGNLHEQFEALKTKLFKQGLFDESHKLPIPLYPKMIGVVTSESGAVIHDILHVAERRNSNIPICLYPSKVQGENAHLDIVRGIEYFNRTNSVDIIIIGRGGGSFEELFEFNAELLAQAIYRSKIPIISAVGHETDFTIADFVADKRAATPSQAAEIAVLDRAQHLERLEYFQHKIESVISAKFQHYTQILQSFERTLQFNMPLQLIQTYENKLHYLQSKLQEKVFNYFQIVELKLQNLQDKSTYFNPQSILKKGFAIIRKDNILISSASQLCLDDQIMIELNDGNHIAKIQ